MTYTFSFDIDASIAKKQFATYVTDLYKQCKPKHITQPSPVSVLRRKRLVCVLTEQWTRHATTHWGPSVMDDEHQPYNYKPNAYDLDRLGQVMLWK